MRAKKILKKMGISNPEKLDFKQKESLVKSVSQKIADRFETYGIKYENIYMKLINTDMYLSDIKSGTPKANYIYKNSSLYIDRSIDISENNEDILRECICKVQEVRNKKNKIHKLGLCRFNESKIAGVAFNEAGMQYVLRLLLDKKEEKVNAYGVMINSISIQYPALTNIIRQMTFIAGENYLVQSIINSTDDFKKSFIDKCNETSYYSIMKNTDLMYEAKKRITNIDRKILFDKKIKEESKAKLREKVNKYSKSIRFSYTKIQKELCQCYFNKRIGIANTIDKLEFIREEIGSYKKLIAISCEEEDNFFDKYSLDCYYKIERKIEKINKENSMLMSDKKGISKAFIKIKKLFTSSNAEYEDNK